MNVITSLCIQHSNVGNLPANAVLKRSDKKV